MFHPILHISKTKAEQSSAWKRGKLWLYEKTILQKLVNPFGILLLLGSAVLIGLIAGLKGLVPAVLVAVVIIGLPIGAALIFNLKFGILVLFTLLFTVLGLSRLIPDIPFGISFDAVTAALVFGLIVRQSRERDWRFMNNPVSYAVLLWIVYTFLLFFNPDAASKEAWVYTIRGFAGIMVLYYVLLYAIDNMQYLKAIVFFWMGIAFVGALYGIFQDTFGLRQFEWNWLTADPVRFRRYYQFGNIRVWSFFSGPMVFGILMALSATAAIALTLATNSYFKKAVLLIMAFTMFWGMLTSGTRAAYIVPIVGLVTYIVLNGNLRVVVASAILGILFLGIVNMPTSNQRLVQFQSAFKPGDDASFDVRVQNQAFIQPFIRSHPLGGGLGSTGVWGQRFSPHSPLAQFPPDSGFVRTAVEAGWIGLLLFNALLAVILIEGIRNYFKIKSDKLRAYQLMFLIIMMCLVITNYPQETINSPPINGIFFLAAAAFSKILYIDRQLLNEDKPDADTAYKVNNNVGPEEVLTHRIFKTR
ncbi:MAG: O-antigen ligase family protein [Balneolales bacterium]|nr:O-antigen ligase family protein [Balneolales bacterium]